VPQKNNTLESNGYLGTIFKNVFFV